MITLSKKIFGQIVQILFLITMTLYVLVRGVLPVIKTANGGGGPSPQVQIIERLARLEECTRKLETIPEKVAGQTEAIAGLKVSVDRLEKKLDNVERGAGGAPRGAK